MTRIGALDGLRGVAILLVVAGHFFANFQPLPPEMRPWLESFANASFGVRLFFVLSGYLITSLLLKEQSVTGTISLARFYSRRAWRILPASWGFLALIALVPALRPTSLTPGNWLSAATYTWNYGQLWLSAPSRHCWEIGHFWTLAMEQQFYLFWPLLLLAFQRRRASHLAALVALWCPIARIGTYFLFPSLRGTTGTMFHTASDSIMIGCLAALLIASPRLHRLISLHGRKGALLAAFWAFVASPLLGRLIRGFPDVAGISIDAVAAAWIILWATTDTSHAASRVLSHGPLRWLGLVSYSLYLWQQIVLNPTGPLASGHIFTPLLLALALALISYHLIERPCLRLGARLLAARSITATMASPAR